jgi:uncharacterized protein (AIM24 family)
MQGDIFKNEHMAQTPTQVGMELQHAKCVKYTVNGEVLARQGVMVAYRGNLRFEVKGQGVGNLLKRAVTGEGLSLMSVQGQGEAWFADRAQNCFLVDLVQGDALTINGRNVMCFDPTLHYEIQMVKGAGMFAGGLFNSVFTGMGRLAITCDGPPIIIPVTPQAPVLVDTDAVVGWSATLQSSIQRSQSLKSIVRGGSGELYQLMLAGQGFVIVQPSEGLKLPAK